MYELRLFHVNIRALYLTILSFVQFMRVAAPPEAVFCSVKASNFVGIVASFTSYRQVIASYVRAKISQQNQHCLTWGYPLSMKLFFPDKG